MSRTAVVRRARTSVGTIGGTLIMAGLVSATVWFLSRREQPDIDARTRARLTPFDERGAS